MNTSRIAKAVRDIDEYEAALRWLRKYGTQLTGRSDGASVTVRLSFAGSCPGSTEAAKTLSAYATLALPDLVKTAIQCCENTIAMGVAAIREEVNPKPTNTQPGETL